MNIEQALYSYLSTYAGLTALIEKRVYPLVMPQGVTLPAVTYQRISDPRLHTMSADTTPSSPRFQLDVWGTNYGACQSVKTQLLNALQDYSGLMGGENGVTVQRIFFEGGVDLYEEATSIYHLSLDFIIWYEG